MSLVDAVVAAGIIPSDSAPQAQKKRFSERLSHYLALEVAEGLRDIGFPNIKPVRGGPGEKAFQGGLGPKKVDVSYADERHGLLLAVSIKSICFAPFGKNLKNRFGDLCTEAITLHMRFPYSVICALFAFPVAADMDVTRGRTIPTFQRATKLFATISGREEYTDPGEKFENVTMMLFQPLIEDGPAPTIRFIDATTQCELTEKEYFQGLCQIYNHRNPHAIIGEEDVDNDEDEDNDEEE
jgi:hypothetical protein